MWIHAMGEYGPGGLHDVAKIRIYNPLALLCEDRGFRLTTSPDWKDGRQCDVFVVERYWRHDMTLAQTQEFLSFVKTGRKKLIYEIDDNLLDLEAITLEQKARIRMLANAADLIVVSTEHLRQRMHRFCSDIMVIPNCLPRKNVTDIPADHTGSDVVTLGYMGTFSHQADFQMIKLPLLQILHQYGNKVRLELIGAVSSLGCLAELPNVYVHNLTGRSSYDVFWNWMKQNIHWDIGLAPLKLDAFTCCKSDIKFLDYAAMGCCGIFSDHPAYASTVVNGENGMLCQNQTEDWYEKMEQLITDSSLRKKLLMQARQTLCDHRLLEENFGAWGLAVEQVMALDK